MSRVSNKIEAKDYSIRDVLDKKKYTIDYFQREFKWQKKHIEQLIADLESAFLSNYKEEHDRREVSNYNSYYLGPIVLSEKDGKRSVIDGQQRLTSLTILLIFLNNLQKTEEKTVSIDSLIYSEKYDEKSFNLDVPERQHCLDALFQTGSYTAQDDDEESVKNIVERYIDVESLFPDELKSKALPFFIDWLIDNVVLVVIIAYSDDNAYTIFETMNDRGLNLTASEMLKGYILSKVKDDPERRTEINRVWKDEIKKLHDYDEMEDLKFFQVWLRAKYAITIRPGSAGSANEDFEKIGTRFHTWVKDNQIKLGLNSANDFFEFVKTHFIFFSKLYRKVLDARQNLTSNLEHLYYANHWGFANSLSDPLLLAPIQIDDSDEIISKKLNLMARYIETFSVYRAANYRNFSQSSIRYTMYNLVLEVRNKTLTELTKILKDKLEKIDENLSGIQDLRMHGQNKRFIKFLLSRITSHIEQQVGMASSFDNYYYNTGGKPFEIEHIWADKFEYHSDEFTQTDEFNKQRNMVGDLILLPKGTNQSFNAAPYKTKLPHYLRENLLAQSLNDGCYERNPNFINYISESGLPFTSHQDFKQQDLKDRQKLYELIAGEIWSLEFFNNDDE